MIPPKHDAEFVACMEDILDIYERPYDSRFPVVCMDEQPVQLIGETRIALSTARGRPQRYDYEYRRNGTAVNFMFTEPLTSWRKVDVRQTKTMIDWAEDVRILLDDYVEVVKGYIRHDALKVALRLEALVDIKIYRHGE